MTIRDVAAQRLSGWRVYGPGLLLATVVGGAASFLSTHYGGPAVLFALLIGMAFNFLATDTRFALGIDLSSRTLLRLAVALMGLRISVETIVDMGVSAVAAVAGLIALTVGSGFLAARVFGRGWPIALLTGGSVAICGASAALALSAIIPRGTRTDTDTLFTVVAVTTLSTVAMVAYPVIFAALHFNDREIGFLLGATIHDVAQVVGAGYAVSDETGEIATVTKLMRVSMLPVVMILAMLALRGRSEGSRVGIPGFVFGFIGFAIVGNIGLLPEGMVSALNEASRYLLVTAIAALGVKTSIQSISSVGRGHLGLVVFETLVIAAASILLLLLGLLRF